MARQYKTCSKLAIAQAYGFSNESKFVRRIKKKIEGMTDQQLKMLGIWTGPGRLLPDQVQVIVELMGTPEEPSIVYQNK